MAETGELALDEPKGKKPEEFTTPQVETMLEKKYAENGEYIVLFNCPDTVGMKQERRCDAVALGMWSRTDYRVHGFEIKISRGDWLRELKDPKKSDPFIRHVDHWWLVTGNIKVAQSEEIPEYWGWLNATKSGLRIMRPPKLIESTQDRLSMSRKWAYGLIQRAHRSSVDEIRGMVQKRLDESLASERERLEREYQNRNRDHWQESYKALQAKVEAAEKASGIELDSWRFGDPETAGKIAKALFALMGRYDSGAAKLKQHLEAYKGLADRTRDVLNLLEEEWTKST